MKCVCCGARATSPYELCELCAPYLVWRDGAWVDAIDGVPLDELEPEEAAPDEAAA